MVVFPLVVLVLGIVWFVIARGLHKASIASLVCAVLFPTIVAIRVGRGATSRSRRVSACS